MTRVALLTPWLYRGGAERWLSHLLRFCDPSRIRWEGIGLVDPGQVHEDVATYLSSMCPIVHGDDPIKALFERSDVLIAWGVERFERYLGTRRPKVVLMSHGSSDWTRRIMESSKHADVVGFASKVSSEVVPADQISKARSLPNCADPAALVQRAPREKIRKSWGLEPWEKALVYLGRMAPEKNPKALLLALPYLKRVGLWEWRAVFVGDGPLQVGGKGVVYAGYTDDVGGVLAAADHLILPSYHEGASLTLLEAWAAGVPVLATPTGMVAHEHPELVRQISAKDNGYGIAKALLADVQDPVGTQARADKAREIVTAEYCPEAFGKRWTDLIVSLTLKQN